jgi:choline dehydrogenase-like flavoprotein
MLMHVLSHGTINIDPNNPHGEPIVDYRSLSNPVDLDLLVEHVKFMRKFILESGNFDEYGPVETSRGPDVKTDEQIKEFIRQGVTPTNYHPVATTSKMPREWGGVVDEEMRVWGVKAYESWMRVLCLACRARRRSRVRI